MTTPELPAQERSGHPTPSTPREAATTIAQRIIAAGFKAYFAGGCVRDELLGLEPTDFDLATDAHPEEIAKLFRGARSVGESFGVMLVRCHGRTIEVATFRTDGKYDDGRRPTHVRFASEEEDAQRRDFTINGLFQHPITGEIIDHVQGQADLAARVLRAIGDPAARLNEDRLRTLRGVRFAARFALRVDGATADAIRDAARDLIGVSRERTGGEVRRMLSHPTRAAAIGLIEEWGLDAPALAEPGSKGSLERVQALPPDASFATALAAWHFDRAQRTTVAVRSRWRDPLNLSSREASDLDGICAIVEQLRTAWDSLAVAGQKRIAAHALFFSALSVFAGEAPQRAATVRERVEKLAQEFGGLAPIALVSGGDLIEMGCAPGPRFKAALDGLYDRQLEGVLATRDEALRVARAEWFFE